MLPGRLLRLNAIESAHPPPPFLGKQRLEARIYRNLDVIAICRTSGGMAQLDPPLPSVNDCFSLPIDYGLAMRIRTCRNAKIPARKANDSGLKAPSAI
jgi:hypothetical protein